MYLGFQPQHHPPSGFLSPLTVCSSTRFACLVSYKRHLWDSKSSVVSFRTIPDSADSRGLPQFRIGMDCRTEQPLAWSFVSFAWACTAWQVFFRIGVDASAIWHATHQPDPQASPTGRRAPPYHHVRLQPYPTQKPIHLATHPRDLHASKQPPHEHLSMPMSTTWFVTELSHNVQLSLRLSRCSPASW